MRRILLSMVLAVSLAGVGHAQETTGNKAEAAKREIIQLEKEKAQALQSSSPADWFDSHDADDVDYTNADGTIMTKAQHLAEWRSGELKLRAVERPCHVHDIHASILNLLGLDHLRTTYMHNGRAERPTVTGGNLITKLWA